MLAGATGPREACEQPFQRRRARRELTIGPLVEQPRRRDLEHALDIRQAALTGVSQEFLAVPVADRLGASECCRGRRRSPQVPKAARRLLESVRRSGRL